MADIQDRVFYERRGLSLAHFSHTGLHTRLESLSLCGDPLTVYQKVRGSNPRAPTRASSMGSPEWCVNSG